MGITLNQLTNIVSKVMTKVKDKFVLKEEGKGLSTNDYSTEDKSKVAKIDTINSNIENIEEITSKIITNGKGTKFLSDNGTYKEVNSTPLGVDGKPIKEYGVR